MAPLSQPLDSGRLIQAQGTPLAELPVDELRALYRECGFLLFRGFNAATDEFYQFGRRFMDRMRTTPEAERRQHPIHRGLQTVNNGLHPLNFHADFGQLPNRPDVICLWCQVPPLSGGQTYVCDGVALWKALKEETRARFKAQRIRQISLLDHKLWTTSAGTEEFEAVKKGMEKDEGVTCTLLPNNAMSVEWKTWAQFKPRFSNEVTLASNLFPFVYNGLITLWEDGTPLDLELHTELHARVAALSSTVEWKAGDFVIVDNTRYLHARAAQDAQRKVFSLQGYLSED
jgi:alpha-ketoglutarate-dependent taurine dioxygenase